MDVSGGALVAEARSARVGPRAGLVAIVVLALAAGCSSSAGDPTDSSFVPRNPTVSLTRQWELGNVPITRSVFLRRGAVIAAGERERGVASTEAITAVDAASGKLRWTRSLRSTANDVQSVAFRGQTLRIVAAEEGVYVSSYGSGGISDPIVGYALGTGVRLFPSDAKLVTSQTVEELVGAVDAGIVTSIGVVRDPATGVVSRLKGVTGTVLAISGAVAFAWDEIGDVLTGYDLTTDQPRWTITMTTRPTIVIIDDQQVLLASSDGWQRLTPRTGEVAPLDFSGAVDPLSSFDTCTSSDFQSVPVGRYTSPVSCDAHFVAASIGDRVQVLDLETGTSSSIAVCDPANDPFAVSEGLFACATKGADGRLSLRLMDARSGFQILQLDEDRAEPVGLAMGPDQLVVSLVDGSLVAYRLTR